MLSLGPSKPQPRRPSCASPIVRTGKKGQAALRRPRSRRTARRPTSCRSIPSRANGPWGQASRLTPQHVKARRPLPRSMHAQIKKRLRAPRTQLAQRIADPVCLRTGIGFGGQVLSLALKEVSRPLLLHTDIEIAPVSLASDAMEMRDTSQYWELLAVVLNSALFSDARRPTDSRQLSGRSLGY